MRRRRADGDSKIILPITPMLLFFIVSVHHTCVEGAFGLAPLPPGAAAPAMPTELTVTVRAHADGSISALSVRTAAGKENAVDGVAGLKKYLKGKRPGMKDTLRIEGDAGLKVRALIEVMDACRDSGFGKLNLAAP